MVKDNADHAAFGVNFRLRAPSLAEMKRIGQDRQTMALSGTKEHAQEGGASTTLQLLSYKQMKHVKKTKDWSSISQTSEARRNLLRRGVLKSRAVLAANRHKKGDGIFGLRRPTIGSNRGLSKHRSMNRRVSRREGKAEPTSRLQLRKFKRWAHTIAHLGDTETKRNLRNRQRMVLSCMVLLDSRTFGLTGTEIQGLSLDQLRKGLDSAYDMHINPGRTRNILSRGSIGERIPRAEAKAITIISSAPESSCNMEENDEAKTDNDEGNQNLTDENSKQQVSLLQDGKAVDDSELEKTTDVGVFDPNTGLLSRIKTQTFLDQLVCLWAKRRPQRRSLLLSGIVDDFEAALTSSDRSAYDTIYSLHGMWQLVTGPEAWQIEVMPPGSTLGSIPLAMSRIAFAPDSPVTTRVQALGGLWKMASGSNEIAVALAHSGIVHQLVKLGTQLISGKQISPEKTESSNLSVRKAVAAPIESTTQGDTNNNSGGDARENINVGDVKQVSEEEEGACLTGLMDRTVADFVLGMICYFVAFWGTSHMATVNDPETVHFLFECVKRSHLLPKSVSRVAVRTLVSFADSETIGTACDLNACKALMHMAARETRNYVVKYDCTAVLARALGSVPALRQALVLDSVNRSEVANLKTWPLQLLEIEVNRKGQSSDSNQTVSFMMRHTTQQRETKHDLLGSADTPPVRVEASSNNISQGESLYRYNCVLCIHLVIMAGFELGATKSQTETPTTGGNADSKIAEPTNQNTDVTDNSNSGETNPTKNNSKSGETTSRKTEEIDSLTDSIELATSVAPRETRLDSFHVTKVLAQVMALGSAQNELHSRIEEIAVRVLVLICVQTEQKNYGQDEGSQAHTSTRRPTRRDETLYASVRVLLRRLDNTSNLNVIDDIASALGCFASTLASKVWDYGVCQLILKVVSKLLDRMDKYTQQLQDTYTQQFGSNNTGSIAAAEAMVQSLSKVVAQLLSTLVHVSATLPTSRFTFEDHLQPLLTVLPRLKNHPDLLHWALLFTSHLCGSADTTQALINSEVLLEEVIDIVLRPDLDEKTLLVAVACVWKLAEASSNIVFWLFSHKNLVPFIQEHLSHVREDTIGLYNKHVPILSGVMEAVDTLEQISAGSPSNLLIAPCFDPTIQSWVTYTKSSLSMHRRKLMKNSHAVASSATVPEVSSTPFAANAQDGKSARGGHAYNGANEKQKKNKKSINNLSNNSKGYGGCSSGYGIQTSTSNFKSQANNKANNKNKNIKKELNGTKGEMKLQEISNLDAVKPISSNGFEDSGSIAGPAADDESTALPVTAVSACSIDAYSYFLSNKNNRVAFQRSLQRKEIQETMMNNMAEHGANVAMITLAVPFLRKTKALMDRFADAKRPVSRLSSSKLASGTAELELADASGRNNMDRRLTRLQYHSKSGKLVKEEVNNSHDTDSADSDTPRTSMTLGDKNTIEDLSGKLNKSIYSIQKREIRKVAVVSSRLYKSPLNTHSIHGNLEDMFTTSTSTTAEQGDLTNDDSTINNFESGKTNNFAGENVAVETLVKGENRENEFEIEAMSDDEDSSNRNETSILAQQKEMRVKTLPKLVADAERTVVAKARLFVKLLGTAVSTLSDDQVHIYATKELLGELFFLSFCREFPADLRMFSARLISVIILGRNSSAKPIEHGTLFGESYMHYFVRFAFLLNDMGISLEPGMDECCAVLMARLVKIIHHDQVINTVFQSGSLPTLMRIVARLSVSLTENNSLRDTNTIIHALFTVCSVCEDADCQEQVSANEGFETLIALSSSECQQVKDLAYDVLFQLKDHPSNVTRAYKAALTGVDARWRAEARAAMRHTWSPDVHSIVLQDADGKVDMQLSPMLDKRTTKIFSKNSINSNNTHEITLLDAEADRAGTQNIPETQDPETKQELAPLPPTQTSFNSSGENTTPANQANKISLIQTNQGNNLDNNQKTDKFGGWTLRRAEHPKCSVRLANLEECYRFDGPFNPSNSTTIPRGTLVRFPKLPNTRILPELPSYVLPDGRLAHFYLAGMPPLRSTQIDFLDIVPLSPIVLPTYLYPSGDSDPPVLDLSGKKDLTLLNMICRNRTRQIGAPSPPRPEVFVPGSAITHQHLGQKGQECGKVLDLKLEFFRWQDIEKPPDQAELALTARSGLDDSGSETNQALLDRLEAEKSLAQPWDIRMSVFQRRQKDTDSNTFWNTEFANGKMFDWDWMMLMRKPTFCRMLSKHEECMEHVKAELKAQYGQINNIFRWFCTADDNKNIFSLGLNEFTYFLTTANITDSSSDFCKLAHMDTIFVAACYNSGQVNARIVSKHNDECKAFQLDKKDRSLLRWEFTECLVRIAEAKFLNGGTIGGGSGNGMDSKGHTTRVNLAYAVRKLWTECLVVFRHEPALDFDRYRMERLYVEAVDKLYAERLDGLRAVFNKYSRIRMVHGQRSALWGGQPDTRMSLHAWFQMVEDLGLLSVHMTRKTAGLLFAQSGLNVVNCIKSWRRMCALSFEDFLEAIARLSDAIVIPSDANLTLLGCKNIIDFYHTAEATGIINEEIFRPAKWARDSVQLLCHSKEQVFTEDPRPLAHKLNDMVTLVLAVEDIKKKRQVMNQMWPGMSAGDGSTERRASMSNNGYIGSQKTVTSTSSRPSTSEKTSRKKGGKKGKGNKKKGGKDGAAESGSKAATDLAETEAEKQNALLSYANPAATFEESVAAALHAAWCQNRKRVTGPDGNMQFEPRMKPDGDNMIDIANLSFHELPFRFRFENLLAAFNACESVRQALGHTRKQTMAVISNDDLTAKKINGAVVSGEKTGDTEISTENNKEDQAEMVLDTKAMELLKSVEFRESASATQHDAWAARNKSRHYVDISLLCGYNELPENKKNDVRLITLTAVRTFCLGVYKVDILNEKKVDGEGEDENNSLGEE